MLTLLLLGVNLGLDSFRVSLALGLTKPPACRRLALGLAFGVCDGVALLVGLLVGGAVPDIRSASADRIGSLVLGLYGVYLLFSVTSMKERPRPKETDGYQVFGIPVLLSLDNFMAGIGLGVFDVPIIAVAVSIGLISCVFAVVGLWLGSAINRYVPFRGEVAGGCVIVALAIAHAFKAR